MASVDANRRTLEISITFVIGWLSLLPPLEFFDWPARELANLFVAGHFLVATRGRPLPQLLLLLFKFILCQVEMNLI